MEGFLAYRHRTEIDFTDADLFVLSGPTGSGKSSVIDAMTFALYGTIPRLDDRRSVAPVISAQSDRARVSFEFSVGDETYTAARLVERNRAGARTTEARLERGAGAETIAGDADEVTSKVIDLLGLTYDHFTKAVVLPQGDFADFLTDKPRDRQALLRALLDIGLFEKVMQLANLRARTAETRAQTIEEGLAKLNVPTSEQLDAARQRLDALILAGEELPTRVGKLSEIESAAAGARSACLAAGEALGRLQAIAPPADLETLDQDRVESHFRLESAKSALAALEEQAKEIEAGLAVLPSPATLEKWQEDRSRKEALRADRGALDLDGLASLVEEGTATRDLARAGLDHLRVENSAHQLRQGLAVGDTCPVCDTVITSLPGSGGPSHEAIEHATADLREKEIRASEARDRLNQAQGQAKQIDERIAEIESRLADAPTPSAVEEAIGSLKQLLDRKVEVDQAASSAGAEWEEAQDRVARLSERASGLRESLFAARDRVAGEEPPIPPDDVVEGWRAFESWRSERARLRTEELAALERAADEAVERALAAAGELREWLEGLDVEPTGSPETDLALATEKRRTEIGELEKTLEDAAELGRDLEVETSRARVASALGTHLRSNNFEAWLLEEAMETLVRGANRLLCDLTGGAYSLLATESQFEVIDHRNADLIRTTKGLSGGETFLVSLSLSLSMAEQLAELTGTSSRLESVLLDEGFGSLDQESLDVVASVLDELVGRGRTVGIITHVRELADRIPVRFEVSKGPETASIEKVLA